MGDNRNCTMINQATKDIVIVAREFKNRWERLGFVEVYNIIPFKLSVAI